MRRRLPPGWWRCAATFPYTASESTHKYTFVTTALRGAYVGGGGIALGETYVHPSWTVPIKSEPVVIFDAVIGYAAKLRGWPVDVRVNGRNLSNRHYLNGTFQYGEPRTVIGSVMLRFRVPIASQRKQRAKRPRSGIGDDKSKS